MKTKFILSCLFVFVVSVSAFAHPQSNRSESEWELKVDSFVRVRDTKTLAELCGSVTGPKQFMRNARVEVKIDPRFKHPATYNTTLSREGKFCVVVRTLTGRVEVTLIPKRHKEVTIQGALGFDEDLRSSED